MPDRNKLLAMRARKYKLVKSCATCIHSRYTRPIKPWAECGAAIYEHEKQGKKPMPAHIALVCEDHDWDPRVLLSLGDYENEPWKGEQ
jgi:hypothetical protein